MFNGTRHRYTNQPNRRYSNVISTGHAVDSRGNGGTMPTYFPIYVMQTAYAVSIEMPNHTPNAATWVFTQ